MAAAMALMELPAVVLFPGAPSGLSPGRPKLARTTARGAEVSL